MLKKKNKKNEKNEYKINLCKNACYFGVSGTGFVNYVGIPAIKKAVEEGSSFVVTDFRGHILKDLRDELKTAGYQVKVLNLEGTFPSDDIDLEMVSKKKTAFFILLAFDFEHVSDVVAIKYVSRLLDILYRQSEENGGVVKVPVRLFFNDDMRILPHIPQLNERLATMPKRGVSFMMRFYAPRYLRHAFGKNWESTLGTCDVIGVLGDVYFDAEYKYIHSKCGSGLPESAIPSLLTTGERLLYRRGKMPVIMNREGRVLDM